VATLKALGQQLGHGSGLPLHLASVEKVRIGICLAVFVLCMLLLCCAAAVGPVGVISALTALAPQLGPGSGLPLHLAAVEKVRIGRFLVVFALCMVLLCCAAAMGFVGLFPCAQGAGAAAGASDCSDTCGDSASRGTVYAYQCVSVGLMAALGVSAIRTGAGTAVMT
jgi:hypothetical protein